MRACEGVFAAGEPALPWVKRCRRVAVTVRAAVYDRPQRSSRRRRARRIGEAGAGERKGSSRLLPQQQQYLVVSAAGQLLQKILHYCAGLAARIFVSAGGHICS
jgi:hypothetical protein